MSEAVWRGHDEGTGSTRCPNLIAAEIFALTSSSAIFFKRSRGTLSLRDVKINHPETQKEALTEEPKSQVLESPHACL